MSREYENLVKFIVENHQEQGIIFLSHAATWQTRGLVGYLSDTLPLKGDSF